jgi:uncharacterized protein YajQ (UPF0234 family)
MADASFDIEVGVDRQEIDNAINQAARETQTRFDFRDTGTTVAWNGDDAIRIESVSEDRVLAALEVLKDKCVSRKVSLKALDASEPKESGGGRYRIEVALQTTMSQELAKTLVKDVKATKLKLTVTNMGDHVRVQGKKRDDLQEIQAMVRAKDYDAPIRFTNYKS